jgi:DNA-binding transcriptional LysR family regulator
LPVTQKLYDLVKPILAGIDSTREILHEEAGRALKEIRIAVGVRMFIEEVKDGLSVFSKKHPDVKIKLLQTDSRRAEELAL